MIFDGFLLSKMKDRLDLAHEFLNKVKVRDVSLEKKIGIYEFQAIDNPIMHSINIDPKEYFK